MIEPLQYPDWGFTADSEIRQTNDNGKKMNQAVAKEGLRHVQASEERQGGGCGGGFLIAILRAITAWYMTAAF
jgi:hypothetical protein